MNCPKCGKPNDDTFKFCQFCSAELAGEPATPATDAAVAPPAQAPYVPYAPPAAPAPAKKKGCGKGVLIALIVILLLVLIGGGATVAWVLTRDKDEDLPTETTVQQETTAAQTEENTEAPAETTVPDVSQPTADEILAILAGSGLDNWDGNWNTLTDEQKQVIEDYYAALGEQIQFGPNGWVVVDEDGTYTVGGQWPNSPLLKDVPKPTYGTIFSSSVEENEVVVTFSGWTPEQLVNYIGQVKAAGFTKDPNEVNFMGMTTYEAHNGSVRINVAQVMGFYAVSVEKL